MKYKHYYCFPKFSDGDKAYYGKVEGVPGISMIEASNLDDFERLFHQAIDDYLDNHRSHKRKTNWSLFVTLLAIVGLLVAMILTCPKKEQHVEVLTDRLSFLINDQIGQENDLQVLGSLIGNEVSRVFLNTYISVDDRLLFSVGRFKYRDKEGVVSVGFLGHVFALSKKELKKRVEADRDIQDFFDSF